MTDIYFPLPQLDPCPFCELISGKADDWSVVERSERTVTLLNGRQYEVGQCIVVPVRHAPTLIDLTEAEDAAIMAAARRITHIMMHAFGTDGVLLYQNNGTGSGQEVPHFHLHVVPRREDSDWGFGPPHIALLERPPAHLDYSVVTEDKRKTAELLREYCQASDGVA
jgi:histidine triad (HIT) family protein